MKKLASLALALTVTAVALPVAAQFAKPEDAIKYRQSALFVMQQNFGRVAAMAAGRAPFDANVAARLLYRMINVMAKTNGVKKL